MLVPRYEQHWRSSFLRSQLFKSCNSSNGGGPGCFRETDQFNLDVIVSVGYRVKFHRGTQFRLWATQPLREYIINGFTLDDVRLRANRRLHKRIHPICYSADCFMASSFSIMCW